MTVILGVAMFTGVVAVLVGLIMVARDQLVSTGDVSIVVNDQKTISVPAGGKLLNALADEGIFVSSACGGGGTCAQCKVNVLSGGGEILATEMSKSLSPKRQMCRKNSKWMLCPERPLHQTA